MRSNHDHAPGLNGTRERQPPHGAAGTPVRGVAEPGRNFDLEAVEATDAAVTTGIAGTAGTAGTARTTPKPGSAQYRAPRWLPYGHAQTIVPALFARKPALVFRRERWTTPDADFIDLDWLAPATPAGAFGKAGAEHSASALAGAAASFANVPLLVLFHGLEGSSDSHYARSLMHAAAARGWLSVMPHFRSCSGAINLAPRFYHSGDSTEIDWILRRLRAAHAGPLLAAGISLGGNALVRWLGEQREDAAIVDAAAAVSAPLDLQAGGAALSAGFNRVYTRNFLKTLKAKCLLKLAQYPRLFDREAMQASRDLHAFDDIVTAPLHGYRNADDYWYRASAKHVLTEITVPTLLLNARNDPFLPAWALPSRTQVSPRVTLDQPEQGGHVGFMTGPFPGRLDWLAQRVLAFLQPGAEHG
jgi:predicted alpha/beta-fold hydrolase